MFFNINLLWNVNEVYIHIQTQIDSNSFSNYCLAYINVFMPSFTGGLEVGARGTVSLPLSYHLRNHKEIFACNPILHFTKYKSQYPLPMVVPTKPQLLLNLPVLKFLLLLKTLKLALHGILAPSKIKYLKDSGRLALQTLPVSAIQYPFPSISHWVWWQLINICIAVWKDTICEAQFLQSIDFSIQQ